MYTLFANPRERLQPAVRWKQMARFPIPLILTGLGRCSIWGCRQVTGVTRQRLRPQQTRAGKNGKWLSYGDDGLARPGKNLKTPGPPWRFNHLIS